MSEFSIIVSKNDTESRSDDLKDGGARIWVETINEIRKLNPTTTMETLIPDFKGRLKDIQPIKQSVLTVGNESLAML